MQSTGEIQGCGLTAEIAEVAEDTQRLAEVHSGGVRR
jgi:hypothetical protein